MSEIKLQASIFQHFFNNYPQTRGLLFHVPNGGKRSLIEASQLKASGVVAGIPDLIFLWNGKCYGIELKDYEKKPDPAQIKIHEIWRNNGIEVFIFWDFDDCVNKIKSLIL